MPSSTVTDLPVFFRDIIGDIEANFQDNLRRGDFLEAQQYIEEIANAACATLIQTQSISGIFLGFNNEGARLLNREKLNNISLHDVAYSESGVYLSIRNLNFIGYPEFRVKRFDVDLECATINVRLFLGQVNFTAELQIVNKTMFANLPMVTRSKMLITISELEAEGHIGLFAVEDSFVPKNYFIQYKFDSAEVEEIQPIPGPCFKPERSTFSNKELSPIDVFATDLHEKLNGILHRQLSTVIVEYSVNELLLDEIDEITSYKSYLHWRTLEANRLIDNLIDKAQNMSMFKNVEIGTKLMISFKQDASSKRSTLTAKGTVSGFSGITRPNDWNYCQNGTEHIYYGYLSIKDYKFTYNYTTEYLESTIEGKIKATIYKNRFAVRVQIAKGDTVPDIKLEIYELSDIEIDISGLGSLNWLSSNIRNVVLGHIRMDTRTNVLDFITRKLRDAYGQLKIM